MLFEKRKSNAGIVLWGDMYELKALHRFVDDIQSKSRLIGNTEESPLWQLLYEIRHAHDRGRRKSTRDWFGEDETPIYGFDWFWTDMLWQAGLLRAAMAFMPTLDRNHQAVMYTLEDVIESSLNVMLPGTGNNFLEASLRIGTSGPTAIYKKGVSRTNYFLTLKPAQRKAQLWAVVNSIDPVWAHFHREEIPSYDEFSDSEYPEFKW
ncbi:hypothetical protein V0M98_36630 (plasmid) [Pseudomonas silesiensis]|uniref:DUF6904 family protein n=1 Tax=Pseudomonas silesiensis TaxID=1853130 RepID=UPI0030CC51DD